ncbi:hypothetical protein M378DRAFT_380360 [Amanita muscaria Koide BX008]|uniref:Uncharacterized protein n=1 Tax=Amanita muscaria (strain Koide BX008) TaxID=946122 RepID=A0A0C2W8R1_AMAMK|nr:hypothetical protein M378DRAFT_380360 [Amanita muscaria Koide BX008]
MQALSGRSARFLPRAVLAHDTNVDNEDQELSATIGLYKSARNDIYIPDSSIPRLVFSDGARDLTKMYLSTS